MNKLNSTYYVMQMARSTTLLDLEKNMCKFAGYLNDKWFYAFQLN